MKNQKVGTGLGTIVLVIIAITVGAFVWVVVKNQEVEEAPQEVVVQPKPVEKNQEQGKQPNNTTEKIQVDDSKPFQYEKGFDYYGTLKLTGYLNLKQHICDKDGMCTKTVNYAYLVITSTDNKSIYDFINGSKGNSFLGDNSVGLGCYEEDSGRIYSTNFGDYGASENIISGNDLQKLLKSNKNNIINIQLTKPYLSGGGGAPDCYSHFRSFKILH